ncbi:uncharacterized protein BKA55DRAFT_575654 [Fusarium redolens]|uniref:Uncharacterized protein n=1 Tax=Fusarium redolens TaxID=48865 RepID=A0A9P9GKA5_FUSRE|nr:uncharacterized protein BKA55DRAFT_575654 [Fusarium redolens]KAH7240721.1 hypothetical protein BKA55DRAFT_575654 [Fusarium redolens]
MSLNGNLESSSIYIAMNSRPSPRQYHWGLIITDHSGRPVLHHASNLEGPWKYEEKQGNSAIDLAMIVIAKVASVTSETRATQVVQSVPADGEPSQRTGETFTCRIWVKDALVKLHDSAAIFLPNDIYTIETQAISYAEEYAADSEQGKGTAVVNDAFGASSSQSMAGV